MRIYTPGVPDKPTIYQLTRSYFPHLLRAGVKIYSYTPGFLHAKTWLVDDRIAAVGTVNLDYRSLYLHFENSVLLYGGAVLDDVLHDLAEIEKGKCRGDAGGLPDRIFWHAVQRGAAAGGTGCAEGRGSPRRHRGLPLTQTGTERPRPLPTRHPCMADRREGS